MNKSEFISFIAENHECSKAEAERALDMLVSSITAAMKKGESINLVGFGSFNILKRAARTGRNPKTGEPLKIKASNQPTFKAGKGLKDACN